MALESATLTEMSALLREREITSRQLTQACLERIAARPSLNAFTSVFEAKAVSEASRCDEEIATGRYRGPLHGIPVALKDLIDVAGAVTTSGSAVPARVAPDDAPVVRRLREAGAVIVGKTNLHEFAFGTTTDETAFGAVRNPFDTSRSAGGSSSGAAVALVEGMCFGSIGTDTGGSIRIPSAVCGTVGLKPTYGELSCDDVVPLSTTCDHVGPMTRTVGDARLMFEAMLGSPVPTVSNVGPLTLGVPSGYLLERVDADVRSAFTQACGRLKKEGHTIRNVEIADSVITPDVYLHIVLPDASQYHAPLLAKYADAYSPGVRLRLEMGRYVLAEDYIRALRLREVLRANVNAALE